MKILILISCLITGCMTGQKLNDKESLGVVSKTMKVRFEVPVEDATIVNYVIARSTSGGFYWTNIKTITALKKNNSVYEFSIPLSYGYYRVRTNKVKGYFFSKNTYVKK